MLKTIFKEVIFLSKHLLKVLVFGLNTLRVLLCLLFYRYTCMDTYPNTYNSPVKKSQIQWSRSLYRSSWGSYMTFYLCSPSEAPSNKETRANQTSSFSHNKHMHFHPKPKYHFPHQPYTVQFHARKTWCWTSRVEVWVRVLSLVVGIYCKQRMEPRHQCPSFR